MLWVAMQHSWLSHPCCHVPLLCLNTVNEHRSLWKTVEMSLSKMTRPEVPGGVPEMPQHTPYQDSNIATGWEMIKGPHHITWMDRERKGNIQEGWTYERNNMKISHVWDPHNRPWPHHNQEDNNLESSRGKPGKGSNARNPQRGRLTKRIPVQYRTVHLVGGKEQKTAFKVGDEWSALWPVNSKLKLKLTEAP